MSNTEKEFFWKDLSGRGFTNTFDEDGLIAAFKEEDEQTEKDNAENPDAYEEDMTVKYFAETAEVGDEFRNKANKIIRTK